MTISYVGAALGNNGTTNNTLASVPFTLPAVQDDDYAVATLHYNSNVSDMTNPSGWTRQGTFYDNGTAHRAWVYTRKLLATDTGVTFALVSGSGRFTGLIDIFRGVDTVTPLDASVVHANTTTGTSHAASAITSVTDDAWIYNVWLAKISSGTAGTTITKPGTHTAGGFCATAIASGAQHSARGAYLTTPAAAGAFGPYTATMGGSTATVHDLSFALRPAAAPAGGVEVPYGTALVKALNLKAGTTGLPAQAAANAWAGTTDLPLQAALNHLNGTTGLPLQAVLNALAGTTGLPPQAAIAAITAV